MYARVEVRAVGGEKKKILFVMNTMGRAGAERAMIALMKSLPKGAVDMALFSIVPQGEMFEELPSWVRVCNQSYSPRSVMDKGGKLRIAGFTLKNLIKGGYVFRHFSELWRRFWAMRKEGRFSFDKFFWPVLAAQAPPPGESYDLVIAYLEGAATYYTANRVNAPKKAAFVHVDYLKAGYSPKEDRPYYEKLDRVFCVSDQVRDSFVAAYPDMGAKAAVFHNILLPDEICRRAAEGPGFEDDYTGLRVLTVARLHPQKALDISIEACALLRGRRVRNFRWYVMGEGEERGALERLIRERQLGEDFVLMGALPNPYPYFAACDVYVQASHFEGWSLSIEEALILQKPTIIAKVAGAEEQVADGETGFVIDLSPQNLAEALGRLLADGALRARMAQNLAKRPMRYDRDIGEIYDLLALPKPTGE